jgi:biopolymer transport protein ExbB/TolQ
MIGSLGWPMLLGGGLCSIFLVLLYQGPLHTPLMMRYFAGHPINLCTTVLFFIGLAALMLKFWDISKQFATIGEIELPPIPEQGQAVEHVGSLLDSLAALSVTARESYLGRRLTELLESVERKGSAAGLDEEIKYLADLDVARQQDSYALVRIVIWAAPMLGFLGTVVGITDALGDLGQEFTQNKEAATNLGQAMNGLLAGLYVAFDTTAQALLLSMVLMFIQFFTDRMEAQLLSRVDEIVNAEMTGRFQELGGNRDPNVATLQRLSETMLKTMDSLVERQTVLWRKSLEVAEQQWNGTLQASGEQLQKAIAMSLRESLQTHAETLVRVEEAASQTHASRWDAWNKALLVSAQALHAQQAEMIQQGAVLTQAVQATGEVIQLEKALNANLSALSGAKNFEETVVSLAAAVNLLSTRLGRTESPRVDIQEGKKVRAA